MDVGSRRGRYWRVCAWGTAAIVLAGACLVIGRSTARPAPASDRYAAGYYDGLQRGNASGREQGRAAQAEVGLPAESRDPVRAAFTAGYVAGGNDAFAGYDGGWGIGDPYVITVERGIDDIIYRINSRTPLQPGVSYYLCPDGRTLCEEPRP